jgi:hypothetical protein
LHNEKRKGQSGGGWRDKKGYTLESSVI